MKVIAVATALLASVAPTTAFSVNSSFGGSQMSVGVPTSAASITMEYIPSGMSKAQWQKMKDKDASKKGKNLGASGITTFKSRTFSDWQKSGGKNLFPVDPNSVKSAKELPYMQRPGGSSDDSDLGQKKGFFGAFGGGNKKKAAAKKEAPPPPPKNNWWTL